MTNQYWLKQTDKLLFPDLEWSKPERRDQAGNLLIIGGTTHALNAPAASYELVKKLGIGDVKVALPSATKKLVLGSNKTGESMLDFIFLPSTPSGELAKEEAPTLLQYAQWANTLLLPGDSGHNSQTVMLFNEILKSYKEQIVITRDAFDILINETQSLLNREKTSLVLIFAQLQKLAAKIGTTTVIKYDVQLVDLVSFLHDFTQSYKTSIVTLHQGQLIAASAGNVSTTKIALNETDLLWRTNFASLAAAYQTWNPHKPFETLTHCAYILLSKKDNLL